MSEKKSSWYNVAYAMSTEYRKEPEDSMYYNVWDKAISLIKNERIIDFGCGSGQFAKLLLNRGKRFVKGYDFSKEAIFLAKEMNRNHRDRFSVRNLLKKIRFPAYDLVICFEVLEHITEDLDVIKKIKPGKKFIFSVPNYDYTSHVRKFDKPRDIKKRYSKLLDIHSIYPIDMGNNKIIYLVKSVKK